MREIAIVSGKGGTGKTTIAAAFAALTDTVILADCDVDAPDMHILLQPDLREDREFYGLKVARIDPEICTECGLCEEHCRFDAAHPPEINATSCEGCKVCEYVCPENAISMKDRVSGHLYDSMTRFGPMSHAKLLPGEGNSGILVTEVRKLAVTLAEKHDKDLILIDGSPGIGCPVIATLTGIKLGVVVTEPTMSGIHDMTRILELLNQFKVKSAVIINKFDLSLENTKTIEAFCHDNGVEVLGRIPFDPIITESMILTKTLPEFAPDHPITNILRKMWKQIYNMV